MGRMRRVNRAGWLEANCSRVEFEPWPVVASITLAASAIIGEVKLVVRNGRIIPVC